MNERTPPAWTLTAALAVAYLIIAPQSPDLAAASYRSYLFAQHGFTLWDNSWYAGHHLPAYSLLAPALGALITPRLVAALSMTAATALFEALIAGRFPARATRIASLWFALGAGISLLSSRVPFDLGLAVGLAAALAAQRRRRMLALALALLTAISSPVAGAFLALAMLASALVPGGRAQPGARPWALALTLAALAPIGVLALLFPEGGTQPFAGSAFYPALAGVLVIGALVPPHMRLLRTGLALYALALIGAFVLSTAVGGNADRLGALAAGPVAACALAGGTLRGRRTLALLVLAPALVYWQANAPVADYVSTLNNPSLNKSFYTPLLRELSALGAGGATRPARVEVVPTADHWEARYVAPVVMLARGWERQLDTLRDDLFYSGAPLTASRYGAWLDEQAVSFVALPNAPLDYSGVAEQRLLERPPLPAYLREVWRSSHWRLFEVLHPRPLAQPPAALTSVGSDHFTLRTPSAGAFTVRLRFTPYWAVVSGHACVQRAPGDWTRVLARGPADVKVAIRFSLARVFARGRRCA